MKSNKIKKILDKILVSFIPVILVVILLNPIPRIISNSTGKDYVSFLGMVYHKHWNDNSPTNHFHMVRIKNADSKTFVVDGKGYSHDKNRFFWGEMQISKAEFDAAMEDLKS
jgi:hypothetical protein